jgi:NTP pyrophosphatase (non-canonical NTP hydrolase)
MTPQQHINLLVRDLHQTAIEKGFWDKSQNVGEKLMLVNTELSEFLESYRKDYLSPDEHCPDFSNQTIELADAVIRILDLAGWLNIHNLGDAIFAKWQYNKSRPYLHGKKF